MRPQLAGAPQRLYVRAGAQVARPGLSARAQQQRRRGVAPLRVAQQQQEPAAAAPQPQEAPPIAAAGAAPQPRAAGATSASSSGVRARAAARRREQLTYRATAIAASLGVVAAAFWSTYCRFFYHTAEGAPFPWLDCACTLALVAGGAAGMEAWARWAHKALWHDFGPGWALHRSHHEPRLGPFEANDVYAIINAVPAIGLCLYGFVDDGLPGSLAFGAGLGITLYGICYMFIHDGLTHKRFPTGPIADLPAMKRIVAAHKLHHSEKYGGVPYGLFLGPQELEAIGAGPDLDRLVAEMSAGGSKITAPPADAPAAGEGAAGETAAAARR